MGGREVGVRWARREELAGGEPGRRRRGSLKAYKPPGEETASLDGSDHGGLNMKLGKGKGLTVLTLFS